MIGLSASGNIQIKSGGNISAVNCACCFCAQWHIKFNAGTGNKNDQLIVYDAIGQFVLDTGCVSGLNEYYYTPIPPVEFLTYEVIPFCNRGPDDYGKPDGFWNVSIRCV